MINELETSRPPIVICETDKAQLRKIALAATSRLPHIADELVTELDRAEICPANAVPLDTVRMNSVVRFRTDKGSEHVMRLVYPEEADIIHDKLSILTPIGTALIGLSEGQTMIWTDREGQERSLTVIGVSQDILD